MMQYPSDAHWSVTRPSVMFVAKMDGTVDVWDFLYRCKIPTLSVNVRLIYDVSPPLIGLHSTVVVQM